MLFSQTVSLIFLLAPSALAAKYQKITLADIRLVPSINVGVDCLTHVYSGSQLRKIAFNSLRFGHIVNFCNNNLCFKKIDYHTKYMSHVTNINFPYDAYYIRVRSSGGIIKGKFAKDSIIVVTKDGLVLGALTKRGSEWLNCASRPKLGYIPHEQAVDVGKVIDAAFTMKDAKPAEAAPSKDLSKINSAESGKNWPAQRDATSPRGSSSPRAADPNTSIPTTADPNTSGSKE